jgi:hypothetical protein
MNRLRRLVGPQAASTGTIGTVPVNHTWILRYTKFLNPTGTAITFKMGIGGTADANLIIQNITVAPGDAYREYMHITVIAGETVQISVAGAGGTIVVNGIDQN